MESNNNNQILLLTKAIEFASEKHRKQKRKNLDSDPYINHPIGVAHLISSIGKVTDVNVLCGAYLHDTVEDTDTTIEEINIEFGNKIREIVQDVTDNKKLSKVERKKNQIQRASYKCKEAKIVKLGDTLHNLLSLLNDAPLNWSIDRIQGYFVWSKFVVQELKGTNSELEDALDKIFSSKFKYKDNEYPCLPNKSLDVALEDYYKLLE